MENQTEKTGNGKTVGIISDATGEKVVDAQSRPYVYLEMEKTRLDTGKVYLETEKVRAEAMAAQAKVEAEAEKVRAECREKAEAERIAARHAHEVAMTDKAIETAFRAGAGIGGFVERLVDLSQRHEQSLVEKSPEYASKKLDVSLKARELWLAAEAASEKLFGGMFDRSASLIERLADSKLIERLVDRRFGHGK